MINRGLYVFQTLQLFLLLIFLDYRRGNLHRVADILIILFVQFPLRTKGVSHGLVNEISGFLNLIDVALILRDLWIVNLTHHYVALVDGPLSEVIKENLILRVELIVVSTTQIIHEILIAVVGSSHILLQLLLSWFIRISTLLSTCESQELIGAGAKGGRQVTSVWGSRSKRKAVFQRLQIVIDVHFLSL